MEVGTVPSNNTNGAAVPANAPIPAGRTAARRGRPPVLSALKKAAPAVKRAPARRQRKEPVLTGRMSYRWSFIRKPPRSKLGATAIEGVRSALGWFKPDAPGMYVLALNVKGHGATYTDEIQVRVLGDDEENGATVNEDGAFIWRGPKANNFPVRRTAAARKNSPRKSKSRSLSPQQSAGSAAGSATGGPI